ncbi:MAG TPA: TlpA disulfide reductase family protein [Streptosporangiaceae bacterium]|nr:TlpA disulfide reductase family protein [Streptosporangiaceae bacterium]
MTRLPNFARTPKASTVAMAALFGAAMLAVTSCSGGPIAANNPLSSGNSFVSGSYSSQYIPPGSRSAAPAITATTLTGQRFSLAAERGSVVVLNFWGSWCAPCRGEAPRLAALATYFRHDPVSFVGDDVHDYATAALAFEHTFNVSYPSLNDPGSQVALAFHSTLPPTAIPSTLVIDRGGKIAARVIGEIQYNGLRALIAKVLADRS